VWPVINRRSIRHGAELMTKRVTSVAQLVPPFTEISCYLDGRIVVGSTIRVAGSSTGNGAALRVLIKSGTPPAKAKALLRKAAALIESI
jgi:hypothetical protein